VIKLHGHYAVVFENSVIFTEGALHFGFIIAIGEFFGADSHISKAGGIGDCFTVFICEFGVIEFWKYIA